MSRGSGSDVDCRIVLADDHRIVLAALEQMLSNVPGWTVVGKASTGAELLSLPVLAQADVVVLDLNIPFSADREMARELPGLGLIAEVRRLSAAKVLVLSMHDEAAVVLRALQLGAQGYVAKGSSSVELFNAIRMALAGKHYLDTGLNRQAPPMQDTASTLARRHAAPLLSDKEMAVARLLLSGLRQKVISETLCISPKTTSTYKKRLMVKLGVASDVALLRRLPAVLGIE